MLGGTFECTSCEATLYQKYGRKSQLSQIRTRLVKSSIASTNSCTNIKKSLLYTLFIGNAFINLRLLLIQDTSRTWYIWITGVDPLFFWKK